MVNLVLDIGLICWTCGYALFFWFIERYGKLRESIYGEATPYELCLVTWMKIIVYAAGFAIHAVLK